MAVRPADSASADERALLARFAAELTQGGVAGVVSLPVRARAASYRCRRAQTRMAR